MSGQRPSDACRLSAGYPRLQSITGSSSLQRHYLSSLGPLDPVQLSLVDMIGGALLHIHSGPCREGGDELTESRALPLASLSVLPQRLSNQAGAPFLAAAIDSTLESWTSSVDTSILACLGKDRVPRVPRIPE